MKLRTTSWSRLPRVLLVLDAKTGPFRIVVAGEKHEARWVRQVTEIDVENAP